MRYERMASQVRKSPAAEENALFDQTLFINIPALMPRTRSSRNLGLIRQLRFVRYRGCVVEALITKLFSKCFLLYASIDRYSTESHTGNNPL